MDIIVGLFVVVALVYLLIFVVKIAFKVTIFFFLLAAMNYVLSETIGIPNYIEEFIVEAKQESLP